MIVGIEMAHRNRDSFDDFFPLHLESVLQLVDHLHVRIEDDSVVPFLDDERITWEYQTPKNGRFFDEATERQALLNYALQSGATWAVCFDSDEVIYSGWDEIRHYMTRPNTRLWGVSLNYCSHHRHDHVLPRAGFNPWRGFKLNHDAHRFRYKGDADGLHCGSVVPHVRGRRMILDGVKVLHHHACTVEDWLGEREFYGNTTEVERHGGIDAMYPLCGEPPFDCNRFGKESDAIPFDKWLAA